jgi:hypothetical protein
LEQGALVATIRERRPGVWEVRVFTGRDASGRPTQTSRTVRGGKRDAQHVAASLEVGRAPAAGRLVSDLLEEWVAQNLATWSPASTRDQEGRVRSIKTDAIASVPLARLSVRKLDLWHARLRRRGMGDAGVKNLHSVLRAALAQAQRWGWVSQNVASVARVRSGKRPPRGVTSAVHSLTQQGEVMVVRLDLLPGDPLDYADALQRSHLLSA